MKKTNLLKLTAVVLTLVTALSLAACGAVHTDTLRTGSASAVNTDLNLSRVRNGKTTPQTQTTEPAVQETEITLEQAKQLVLEYLNLEEATFTELDKDRDEAEYELEVKADGVEYEFEVNAVTGNVRLTDKDVIPVKTEPTQEAPKTEAKPEAEVPKSEPAPSTQEATVLTEEQIRALVLEHFGVSQAEFHKVRYERDDREYDVEVTVDGARYELEVNAFTGKIREVDREDDRDKDDRYDDDPYENDARPVSQPETGSLLTPEQAKEAVRSHFAGSEIRFLEYELDDGVYEFEILVDGREYDVEVSAATGKILETDRDD